MTASIRTAGLAVFWMSLACALLFALASSAHADITDPFTPYQPDPPKTTLPVLSSEAAQPQSAPADPIPEVAPAAEAEAADAVAPPAAEAEPVAVPETVADEPSPSAAPTAPATPVPETSFRATTTPRAAALSSQAKAHPHPLRGVIQTIQRTTNDFGTSLVQAASACQVGVGSGGGVPLLVFAVLGTMTALTRHRVLGARSVADEEVPEMLYAWDVIAPG